MGGSKAPAHVQSAFSLGTSEPSTKQKTHPNRLFLLPEMAKHDWKLGSFNGHPGKSPTDRNARPPTGWPYDARASTKGCWLAVVSTAAAAWWTEDPAVAVLWKSAWSVETRQGWTICPWPGCASCTVSKCSFPEPPWQHRVTFAMAKLLEGAVDAPSPWACLSHPAVAWTDCPSCSRSFLRLKVSCRTWQGREKPPLPAALRLLPLQPLRGLWNEPSAFSLSPMGTLPSYSEHFQPRAG